MVNLRIQEGKDREQENKETNWQGNKTGNRAYRETKLTLKPSLQGNKVKKETNIDGKQSHMENKAHRETRDTVKQRLNGTKLTQKQSSQGNKAHR